MQLLVHGAPDRSEPVPVTLPRQHLMKLLERLPTTGGMSTGRITESAEIAALIVFLASGKALYISGSDLVIDGGLRKEL